jgi:sugar-specific transcriptional regulator TrmB
MNTSTLLRTLYALGCTHTEACIYLYLAQRGASNISTIADGTHLSRVTTYTHIDSLISKKFITTTKIKERTLYEVCDPSSLLASLDQVYKEGSRALTTLSSALKETFFVPKITTTIGESALSSVYDDIARTLPKGGTYFRYTSRVRDHVKAPLYSMLRKEKELERLVITSVQKAEKKEKDSNRFIKTVPKDFSFDDNVTLLIYGNKITHIDHTSLSSVTIESPQLARFQEKIFKLLWKKL